MEASVLCEKYVLLGDATTDGACTVYFIVSPKMLNWV